MEAQGLRHARVDKQRYTDDQRTHDAISKPGRTDAARENPAVTMSTRKRAASSGAAYRTHQAVERDIAPVAGTSRERSLQAELDTAKRQVAFLPFLKEKFDALVTEHAESKARYASKTSVLKEQVTELEKKCHANQADSERLRAENLAKTSEVRTLGNELGRLRSAKGEVEQQLKESQSQHEQEKQRSQELEEELEAQQARYKELATFNEKQTDTLRQQASAALSARETSHDATKKRLDGRSLVQQFTRFKLDRKIEEKDDQVCQLVELILQSEEEQSYSESRIEDLEDDVENIERSRATESRLFRQERRCLIDQVTSLTEDIKYTQEQHLRKEQEWRNERSVFKREINTAVSILNSQEEALATMQSMSMAKFELEQELWRKKVDLEEALQTITVRDAEVHKLQKDLERLSLDKEELSNDLAAVQDQLHATEQDLNNERAQRRHLSSLLIQSQATETQLQDEVFSLQNDLVSYLQLQETHADLIKNLDRLMRTADLAEEDAKELARMNSELAGHNNPNQRIRQLDRLRNELAELKKKYVNAQADLAGHKGKIAALEAEVSSYKSVDEQRPKIIKHVQALKNSTNMAKDMPLGSVGFGHVSVRKNNIQQVDQNKAARVFGQRGPVKSFLS